LLEFLKAFEPFSLGVSEMLLKVANMSSSVKSRKEKEEIKSILNDCVKKYQEDTAKLNVKFVSKEDKELYKDMYR
jgi:ssRNA-specific RNase YbeY (16S rRNA maturation enzyme)